MRWSGPIKFERKQKTSQHHLGNIQEAFVTNDCIYIYYLNNIPED